VEDIRGPRPAKTLPVVLSPAEVARFFRAIPSLKQRTILMIAYGAGLRVGEVVELRLSDIDRQRSVIHVRQGMGKKDRYTTLSPALAEMLDRYLWAAHAQPCRQGVLRIIYRWDRYSTPPHLPVPVTSRRDRLREDSS
jgi:integrase